MSVTVDVKRKKVTVTGDDALRVKRDAMKCTPRQARLAMASTPSTGFGSLLEKLEYVIDNLPEPQRAFVSLEWEYTIEIARNDSTVKSLIAPLGLSETEIDALFEKAMAL